MSFLYEQAWWRRLVTATKTSNTSMALFTTAAVAVPCAAGYAVMEGWTNSSDSEARKERMFAKLMPVQGSAISSRQTDKINTKGRQTMHVSSSGRTGTAASSSSRGGGGAAKEEEAAKPFSSSAVMGRVNKERLQVLLDDVRAGRVQERYELSLRGKTKGTSSLSSAGNVRGIQTDAGDDDARGSIIDKRRKSR